MQIVFEYYQKLMNGKYLMPIIAKMSMCDVTKLKFYPKILEVSNMPPPNTCPLPKVRNGSNFVQTFNRIDYDFRETTL